MDTIKQINTILSVPSIEDTVAWYKRVLGWDGCYDVFDDQGRCLFGSVMSGNSDRVIRGEAPFLGFDLSRLPEGEDQDNVHNHHFTALIHVDDVDAVYAQVVANGADPAAAPMDQFWGSRTFSLLDLNGYRLTFAQEIETVDIDEIRRRHDEIKGKQ